MVEKNVLSLSSPDGSFSYPLTIALISDLHLSDTKTDYENFSALLADVLAEQPDLILILGDMIAAPASLSSPDSHRSKVINLLKSVPEERLAVVLGNYESWDDRNAWLTELKNTGVLALENEVALLNIDRGQICIRGLGDIFTNYYAPTFFLPECQDRPRITVTHDPAAAFQPGVHGLIFAGHTHCGQVAIPFLGPLWAPTEAPRKAWCGLYEDELRTLWVSSGVGTSILPVRLGTRSE